MVFINLPGFIGWIYVTLKRNDLMSIKIHRKASDITIENIEHIMMLKRKEQLEELIKEKQVTESTIYNSDQNWF